MCVLDAYTISRTRGVLAQSPQFAITTSESRRTLAVISAYIVDAITAVGARSGQALVEIQFAILTLETGRTLTDIGTVIIEAHAIIQTWICLAFVDVHLTIGTLVTVEKQR